MKSTILGLMLWTGMGWGQAIINPTIMGGAGAPSNFCANGELYFNSSAAPGQNLYVCVNSAWSQINGTAPGAAMTNASNTYTTGTVQTFKGTLDASTAAATLPAQTGASLPATCGTGQMYLMTGGDASRMLYVCSAANTWTQASYAQGTVAQKPAVCAMGQIYFATDAAAGSNLHFCTASNTWTQMAGCSSCVTGPGSSTNGNVPAWNGTTGASLGAGYAVSQSSTANSLVLRDSSGNISVGSIYATGGAGLGYQTNFGWRLTGGEEAVTCSSGAAALSGLYTTHRVSLNNQANCTITPAAGASNGQLGIILLCNGGTTPTTAITWSGLKGGIAAGGTAGQCAGQMMLFDNTNNTWYATGAGSSWN